MCLQQRKKLKKEKMKDIETDTHVIYHIAKQMKHKSKDMVAERCIQDNGVLAINEEEKKHENSIMKGYWMSNSPGEKRICQLLIQYLDTSSYHCRDVG